MNALLGTVGVLTALISSGMLVVRGVQAARGRHEDAGALKVPALGVLIGAVVAMGALELALLTDDFTLAYLANGHARSTPLVYTIATAWAALEGSIVLWGLVLAGFTYSVFRQVRRQPDILGFGALAVMGAVGVFFFGMMATVTNPFEVCVAATASRCLDSSVLPWAAAQAPIDGFGPNPLLQNHILMAVHPPLLYLGYVGMTVPFAFGMSALALRVRGSEWILRTRRWTLVAWSFLTAGIVIGAWWSYEVLGWGGYWAWDPVENASFMPWLIATAFLHSAVVQARRGVLQAWNFVLVIGVFSLTILGTFLTRSGTINSVHSFTQSAVGPALLGFLLLVLVASFSLFALRAHLVSSSPRLESLASREGAFLANNLLLAVFGFVVLIGTVYPLFVEAFTGARVGVGRPFYDRLAVPLSFGLLLAMGIGPVTPYRIARWRIVWPRLRIGVRVALAAAGLLVIFGLRQRPLVIAVLLAAFVAATIVDHLVRTVRARRDRANESALQALTKVVSGDPGFWGGQLSHLGVAILSLGIATTSILAVRDQAVLTPGDQVTFAGYDVTYITGFERREPVRSVTGAALGLERNGRFVGEVEPRLNKYDNQDSPIATPALHRTLTGDVYFSLTRIDSSSIAIQMSWFPFQWLVWFGGLLAAAGGAWSVVTVRRRLARMPVG